MGGSWLHAIPIATDGIRELPATAKAYSYACNLLFCGQCWVPRFSTLNMGKWIAQASGSFNSPTGCCTSAKTATEADPFWGTW